MRRLPRPVRLDFVAPVHRAPLADAALGARAQPRHAAPTPESLKRAAEAATVERELSIPWTRLLAELEAASHDSTASVSLLQVEPDPVKQRVRITAEVRALNDALAYLQRLQKIAVLRHPMLESHERRKDDPEHPLRITLSAEWRT